MLLDALLSGDIKGALITFLMMLPIIMLSLSVHEASHAYVAYKMGDPTARNLGRCTINPLKHLDPVGFLAMLLIGFGWAKPVPIYARNFEKPRKGMAISSLAGPLSNLFLALIMGLLFGVAEIGYWYSVFFSGSENLMLILSFVVEFFFYGVFLNISLAIFNFIPIPPLDGSRILGLIIPAKYYVKFLEYERYIGIGFALVVIALSYMGISLISWIVNPVTLGILRIFDTPAWAIFEAIWLK